MDSKKIGRIAVDFDGVIGDFLEHLVTLYNEDFDDDVKVTDFTGWDIEHHFKCGKEIWTRYLNSDTFFDGVKPIDGAIETLADLHEDFDIFVVTATDGYIPSIEGKIRWLKKHLPFITPKYWVFCGKKDFVNANFLVDDGVHNLEVFTTGTPILFSSPHNRYETRFARAEGWNDVKELVYKIKEV